MCAAGPRRRVLRNQLELAVAVELVAEQVSQQNGAWAHPLRNLWQGALVDLEEAELCAARRKQRGGDP